MNKLKNLRVILASAGSGKTQRLAELAIETLQKGQGVLAITFTRNAAAELRERILTLLKASDAPLARKVILGQAPLYTQTIDSLTRELYQHIAPLLGVAVYQDVVVEEEDYLEVAHILARRLIENLHQSEFRRLLLLRVEKEVEARARRILPEALLRRELLTLTREGPFYLLVRKALAQSLRTGLLDDLDPEWQVALQLDKREALFLPFLSKALETYRQETQRLFLSDISALVRLTARYLGSLLAEHTSFYAHLLVDEAQDTSPQQWEILSPLMEELRSRAGSLVSLIGDPKQSIYAWREADFRKLIEFYEQAEYQETLIQNFRSAPTIVEWNNQLYGDIAQRLRDFLINRKNSKSKSPVSDKASILDAIETLYTPSQVLQQPTREVEGWVEVVTLAYSDDPDVLLRERARKLQEILAGLRAKGVSPEETAFLVRRNDEIPLLMEMLPGYPLQVQDVPLRSCSSLHLTFRYLAGEAGPVEELYAARAGMVEAVKHLKEKLTLALTPLDKWRIFYDVAQQWLRILPQHQPFWALFLSELYGLLSRHTNYGWREILIWWQEKAQNLSLHLPPTEGVYPILTIHKAKGLAWQAVIIPFAEWGLLQAEWRDTKWRLVPRALMDSVLAEALREIEPLFPQDTPIPLPLKIKSEVNHPFLRKLYEAYAIEQAIENLNLHYVATTRPRQYLYLIAAQPGDKAYKVKGANTWRGFWNEPQLSKVYDGAGK